MSSVMEETVLNSASPGESTSEARVYRIGDVVEKITGGCSTKKTDYISDGVLVLNKGHIKGYGIVDIGDKERFVSDKYASANLSRVVKKDTVLVTLRDLSVKADFLGLIGTYKKNQDALITQGMYALALSKEIYAPYLVYYSNSPGYRAHVKRNKIGSTQVHLRNGQFLDIKIPLPEVEQQKRIVAKIEELFSHIDAGIEALKKAKQLLKQYRQSVLKAAVTGELTKEWREANKDKLEPASQLLERILKERQEKWEEQQLEQFKAKGKMPKDDKWKEKYKEPKLPNINEKLKIPDVWCWVSGDQSASKIVDGAHHTPKYTESGVPFISVKDIRDDTIHFDDTKFISQETHEKLIQRCHPEKNDLLITKSGTIGRTAIIDTDREFSLFVSVALVKRITDDITPMFFRLMYDFYIQSIDVQQVVKGGMIKNLHLEDMRVVGLPLAPTLEQNIIVEEFEKKIESIRRLEKEIDMKLLKAEMNKQSVLASAFSGNIN